MKNNNIKNEDKKFFINLDKLVVAYHHNKQLEEQLNKVRNDMEFFSSSILDFKGFRLKNTNNGKKIKRYYKDSYDIYVDCLIDNQIKEKKFGTLHFNSKLFEDNKYMYIAIENEMLYREEVNSIYYISDCLGLSYSHVCSLDIAIDSNVDFHLYPLNFNKHKNVIPIIRNKKIKDRNKKIKKYGYNCDGSINEPFKDKTLYIKNEDNSRILLCRMYNKKEEIEEVSKKYYIIDKLEIKGKNLYRLEMSVNSKSLYESLKNISLYDKDKSNPFTYREIISEELYSNLFNKPYILKLFNVLLNRLIRVNVDNKTISFLEYVKEYDA